MGWDTLSIIGNYCFMLELLSINAFINLVKVRLGAQL